jgi:hypothetical protein
MTGKPPYPANNPFAPWPWIPVDQTAGSDFQHLRRAAATAVDDFLLNGDAPSPTAPRIEQMRAAVAEALLYLLEMGLIDIDEQKLTEYIGTPHPLGREGR